MATVAGDTVAMFSGTSTAPQIKAGKLKAIATTYDTRITAYKDIPTTKEAGYPGVKIGARGTSPNARSKRRPGIPICGA